MSKKRDVSELLSKLPAKERIHLQRGEGELVIWHENDRTTEIPMGDLSMYERHTIEREKDGRLHGGYPF